MYNYCINTLFNVSTYYLYNFMISLTKQKFQRLKKVHICLFPSRIDIIKYVIYGIASAFFVYGILLMVEGFFTSGAIKDLYGDFKITTCGRCVSAWVRGNSSLNDEV